MRTVDVSSWGNTLRAEHALVQLESRFAPFPGIPTVPGAVLPFGNGRSYGDSCLNTGGTLVRMRGLDRFIRFDRERGILECEAGVLLDEVLSLIVPAGWFVPVTPGTRLVTLGGAIANDVHGKNHHRAGTFGCHVQRLRLLRSDSGALTCSPEEHPHLFAATIGGLGLTGIITCAQIGLRPISGPWLELETIPFGNLDEFLQLCADSDREYEYTVSWIDCGASGRTLGRGIFQRANHASISRSDQRQWRRKRPLNVPVTLPVSAINSASARVLSALYYRRQCALAKRQIVHYEPFFYPLDGVGHWNRLYGPRGFYQYQCVLPPQSARSLRELLESIARSGIGTFLSVLKAFGDIRSPGMLSFPCPGLTLAVDLPANKDCTPKLFAELDAIVGEAGGRLYPAKDARMPGELFRAGYPRWQEFSAFIDPRCSSSFWRRVTRGT